MSVGTPGRARRAVRVAAIVLAVAAIVLAVAALVWGVVELARPDYRTTMPSVDAGDVEADAGASYALLRAGEWRLQEAVDPPEQHTAERPALDWYAEYVSTSQTRGMLRLSGHRAGFDDARSELEAVGFALAEVEVAGRGAAGGTTGEAGSAPVVVLLDSGPMSLLLLSYELDVAALAELAGAVETVERKEWIDAGGVVR